MTPGGFTYDVLAKKPTTIFEASRDYIDNKVPLVVLAGKEYGTCLLYTSPSPRD